jgi:hypothetical protein
MNQSIVRPNEFILRITTEGDAIHYRLENPHTKPGADGKYEHLAWHAAHGLLELAKIKLKRTR